MSRRRIALTAALTATVVVVVATQADASHHHYRAETGVASWYGPGFAGRPTSSGQIYRPNRLTAAHNRLALGTRVRVTNLSNHRAVTVKINDRGSFGRKYHRLIDLSRAAAARLHMVKTGVARVRIEVITRTSTRPHRHHNRLA
jgi:rare lipoprotein A